MKLIYLSTDELNRALVRAWARRAGVPIVCTEEADRVMGGTDSAILLDMDHLPFEWLEAVLTRLGAWGEVPAVAAHGYGPYGDQLRSRGLTVHPRLDARVVADLVATAMSADLVSEQVDGDALTWINLA